MQSIGDRDGAVGATSASGAAAPEGLAAAEHSEHLLGEQDVAQDARLYTLPGLEGQWTVAQLVELELQKDPRFTQVRRGALPPEFWDARRRARNRERTLRNYQRRRRKGDAQREQDASRKAGLTPEQAAAFDAEREAQREAAKAAAAAQRAAVAEAMASGLRIAIDCSLSAGANEREVRSLCKQLQECAAANKRARRPVSLQFAGFAGAVRSFAVEGMHADRWPAAAGHEAALAELFPAHDLVVLSPDAEDVLEQLEADKVYVIGGLVDRTVRKGASLGLAQRCGARAVRLPIAEHLGSAALGNSKGVLNVNDVFNALLAVHAGDSWLEALDAAIPQRFRIQQPGSKQQVQQGQQQTEEPQQQQLEERQGQPQQERRQRQATAGLAAAQEDAQAASKERQPSAVRRQRPPAAPPCGCCLS